MSTLKLIHESGIRKEKRLKFEHETKNISTIFGISGCIGISSFGFGLLSTLDVDRGISFAVSSLLIFFGIILLVICYFAWIELEKQKREMLDDDI